MSIAIDEIKRLREMMQNFLYALHGYGLSEIDFASIKKEQNKTKVEGSFTMRNEKFGFTAEFNSEGHLVSYMRTKSVSGKRLPLSV